MPKPRAKKKTEVASSMTKSTFLHGTPNVEKRTCLENLQTEYTNAVNEYLERLSSSDEFLLQILKGSKKDSELRKFEKEHRIERLQSAYSQNAFDEAVTLLHNWWENIKREVFIQTRSFFASVIALYYCVLTNKTRDDMIHMLTEIMNSYKDETKINHYKALIDKLSALSDEEFQFQYNDVYVNTLFTKSAFKFPHVKKAYVKLDSRVRNWRRRNRQNVNIC